MELKWKKERKGRVERKSKEWFFRVGRPTNKLTEPLQSRRRFQSRDSGEGEVVCWFVGRAFAHTVSPARAAQGRNEAKLPDQTDKAGPRPRERACVSGAAASKQANKQRGRGRAESSVFAAALGRALLLLRLTGLSFVTLFHNLSSVVCLLSHCRVLSSQGLV